MNRLAGVLHRRAKVVLLLAAAVVAATALYGAGAFGALRLPQFEDRESESVRAATALRVAAGYDVTPGLIIRARAGAGDSVATPAAEREIERIASELRRDPAVARVSTPAEDPALVSRGEESALIVANFRSTSEDVVRAPVERLREEVASDELELRFGGPATAFVDVAEIVEQDLRRAELLAFPILFVLLVLVFRGLVAAALPLLLGVVAVFAALAGLRALNELVPISVTSVNLVSSLGLGLAVDYSLFLVSRYREELAAGKEGEAALATTLATAGRTVVISALTVAAALAALCVFPQRFLYSMGLGGVFVTLFSAVAAVVIVGGLLAILGPRVNALGFGRRAPVSREGRWYRLAVRVQRRPIGFATLAAAALLALGVAGLGLQTTGIDASVLPDDEDARIVDRAIDAGFSPLDAPVLVAVEAQRTPRGERSAERMRAKVARLGSVVDVKPQRLDDETVLLTVFANDAPFDAGASELVGDIRALRDEAPPFLVGGPAAGLVDFRASIADHLPAVLALLVGTTLVLLFALTGSVLLPLKSVLMNVLTVAGAVGFLVLLFQQGRLEGVLDYESQDAIELATLLLVGALAFGLSTDYGVFLLARIKELRDGGAADEEAIALATQRTAGLITAAALLFIVAIGALCTSSLVFLKETGAGCAFAVLIDATLVRLLLVPSLMRLLGRANWWAPRPLRALHRRLPALG